MWRTAADLKIGDRVPVLLSWHCGDPARLAWGVIEFVFPGAQAFTVRFEDLRSEVVSLHELESGRTLARPPWPT